MITLGSLKTLDSMVVANLTTSYVRVELRDNLNFPITTPAMESQIVMEVRTNGGSVEVNTDAVTIIDRGEPRTIQTKVRFIYRLIHFYLPVLRAGADEPRLVVSFFRMGSMVMKSIR